MATGQSAADDSVLWTSKVIAKEEDLGEGKASKIHHSQDFFAKNSGQWKRRLNGHHQQHYRGAKGIGCN